MSYDEVFIEGNPLVVVRATYGPAGSPRDYTQQVRALVTDGTRLHIRGNVHTVLGDPVPGAAKIFAVTFTTGGGGTAAAARAASVCSLAASSVQLDRSTTAIARRAGGDEHGTWSPAVMPRGGDGRSPDKR